MPAATSAFSATSNCRSPGAARTGPCGVLRNAALATSQVAAARDDAFPADIIGPAGLAPQQGVWSVLARSAWRADALTKVAAIAPAATRGDLLARLGGQLA